MAHIYHLALRSAWEAAPTVPFRAASLDTEGFIHCSYAHQVAGSANRFYADADELLVLTIDPARLTHPLKAEPARSGELFPHVHGTIDRAVVSAQPVARDEDGKWIFVE